MTTAAILMAMAASAPTQTEITVYNQGFALVKEVRNLELRKGEQSAAIEDVAQRIEPSTVSIRSLDSGLQFRVLEQNYQYDLISPAAILNKSIGQKVSVVRAFGGSASVLKGTLLSAPTTIVRENGEARNVGMVVRSDDGRIVLDPVGEVSVDEVPEGLISRPTLLWLIDSPKAGKPAIELSYLTQGMTWNADYVLTLDGLGKSDLQGWVTIDNQSGATFNNAKLKLLAGDVQRVQPQPEMIPGGRGAVRMEMKAANAFEQEALFEYHLYTLQRPATVKNRETKQLSLLEGRGIPIEKKLIVDAMMGFRNYFPSEGEVGTGDIKPQVRVEFVNDTKSGLGMPLPKGRVRVFQRDQSGSVQMLGEDQIDHTPRNERISLVVGRSFDVVSSRRRTNYRRISDRSFAETFEIEVRNRKETPETVYVLERSWGDWRVTEKNMEFTKLDANTFQFKLDLKPNEVKKVVYTIETRW